MLINLRTSGAVINIHVIRGVLSGLIRANPNRFGYCVNFEVTKPWVRSLYLRMNYSRRIKTTSRPVITHSIWTEIRTTFLHDVATQVHTHNIPDKLILNSDETSSNFVPTSSITMAEKGSRHVSAAGADDTRASTVNLVERSSGEMLPFQVIYQDKTDRCLPKVSLPKEFLVMYNEKHWSNEQATLCLIDHLVVPYITKVKA